MRDAYIKWWRKVWPRLQLNSSDNHLPATVSYITVTYLTLLFLQPMNSKENGVKTENGVLTTVDQSTA